MSMTYLKRSFGLRLLIPKVHQTTEGNTVEHPFNGGEAGNEDTCVKKYVRYAECYLRYIGFNV